MSKNHLFDQLKEAGRSIMEGQQDSEQTVEVNGDRKPNETERRMAGTVTSEDVLSGLIRDAAEWMVEAKRHRLEELGMTDLTVDMFGYVDVIGSLDKPNASAIAKALNLTRPSVTAILNKLERKGILEKRRDREDARAVRIELTPSGKSMAEAYGLADLEFARAMVKRLEPEEFSTLVHLLAKGMDRDVVLSQ